MPTSDSPLQKSHGPFYAVAREAGLKVTEMSCSYGQTCHPLEFRHGPKAIAGRRLRDLVRELGFTADYALAIHAGPAAIGYVGYGHHRARTAVGDTVLAAQMLRDVAAASSTRFVVSRAAAAAAGMPTKDIDWRPVAVRGARPTVEITGSERAIRFDSMPSNR